MPENNLLQTLFQNSPFSQVPPSDFTLPGGIIGAGLSPFIAGGNPALGAGIGAVGLPLLQQFQQDLFGTGPQPPQGGAPVFNQPSPGFVPGVSANVPGRENIGTALAVPGKQQIPQDPQVAFLAVLNNPNASQADKLNAFAQYFTQSEAGAVKEDIALRGEAVAGLEGVGGEAGVARAADQAAIQDQINRLNLQFDPILSQFSTLFDRPTITPEIEAGLRANIRGASARGLESSQEQIRQRLGSRGLSGSTLEARTLAEARQGATSGRVEGENTLAGLVADLNRRGQLSAAVGGVGAAGTLGGLQNQLFGQELGTSRFGTTTDIAIQGVISDINLGRDVTPQDLSGLLATSFGLDAAGNQELAQFLAEQEEQNPNFLNFLAQTILPNLLGRQLDLNEAFALGG